MEKPISANEPNRQMSDALFKEIFSEEERLKSLVRFLKGEKAEQISVKTLRPVIFGSKMNDLSFLCDEEYYYMFEVQSTNNPNIPYRMLEYITRGLREAAELFNQKEDGGKDTHQLYSSKQLQLPEPKLYAMVTGLSQKTPAMVQSVRRLSDLYITKSRQEEKGSYSLEVLVDYFDFKMNQEEVREYLSDVKIPERLNRYAKTDLLYYALFVNAKIYLWQCRKEGQPYQLTYEEDILWLCDLFQERGIFVEIFKEEERKMSIVEAFSYEEDIREAGIEQGLEQGLEWGLERGILGAIDMLKSMGMDSSSIKQKIQVQYHLTEEDVIRYMNLIRE